LLIDTQTDALETNPQPPTAGQETGLSTELRALRAALDRAAELERPKTVVPDATGSGHDPSADAALRDQLAHLGYL
jgi:hypothetical protein